MYKVYYIVIFVATCSKISDDVDVTIVLEEDGTVVDSDDYLNEIDPQTVLVFLKPSESWMEAGEQVYNFLRKLFEKAKQPEAAKEIRELLTGERSPEIISTISHFLDQLESNPDSEERHEHEDWFEGVHKNYKSKSQFMRNAAKQRIRSYYTSAKDQIDKLKKGNDPIVKTCLDEVMNKLKIKLEKNYFHDYYFDRTSSKNKICDKSGWFTCQGPFDEISCSNSHTINPYASRGFRLLFALWNLDHIVEKSREVIPKLVQAAQRKPSAEYINSDLLYEFLFMRKNLRFVFVGCHKKAAREQTVNVEKFYIS